MINLNYQMDHFLYHIFRIIFKYSFTKHGEDIDKPSVQIFVNKIENRITFKIKNEYSLELLTQETMKLLGSTDNKITKIKMVKTYHISKLQKQYWFIFILLIMIINKIQESCIRLFPINLLIAC